MKPIIKLFNKTFTLVAIIDDYQSASFEHNLYQAGTFTITINYNIPNAKLFERGLFVQFGDNPYDFGEIISVNNTIGSDGKGSEFINVTGYDARYLFKRRVIKNLNNNDTWSMTAKGELCMRNLVKDQCGTSAESKRQLPITNTIPLTADALGSTYSVSEAYSNLYDVLCTIATQSEIGWAVTFNGTNLTLEIYVGSNLSNSVFFSTDFESLANGNYKDSSESFANSIYIGGKGTGSERDIYEGEDGTPEGIDRFEAYDNQSSMTTEDEYEAEALSMLSQYGQTVSMSGAGLAKCPYIFREQYNIGDIVKLSFSGKSANVQILSVTENWKFNNYGLSFNFGKPINTLNDQLNLILRKIQEASNKNKACESVKWYDVATDTEQSSSEVTFNTLGFTGIIPSGGATFTLYRDDEGTGAKSYIVYTKNLSGSDNLILTTGVVGATTATISAGNAVINLLVDTEGNIISQSVSQAAHAVTADTATILQTGRTVQTDLSSSTAESFDGSADITPGVTGVLDILNGGTGATTILGILQMLRNGVTGASAGNVQSDYGAYIVQSKFTTTSGYVKYSNGLIVQWKYVSSFKSLTAMGNNYRYFPLPISFTNYNYYVNVASTNCTHSTRVFHCGINTKSSTGFNLNCRGSSSGGDYEYQDGIVAFAIGF